MLAGRLNALACFVALASAFRSTYRGASRKQFSITGARNCKLDRPLRFRSGVSEFGRQLEPSCNGLFPDLFFPPYRANIDPHAIGPDGPGCETEIFY